LSFAGKHRGIVEDNADPLKLGRLKVRVDAAYGAQPVASLPWAWPCFAYGGFADGGFFAIPEAGSGVWVEFQWKDGQPDTTYPVWTGVWLSSGDTPEEVKGPPEEAHFYAVFKTAVAGHKIVMCSKPGEECIRIMHGIKKQTIEFGKDGVIYIKSASGEKLRLNPSSWSPGE
jgi:hypothetical protein